MKFFKKGKHTKRKETSQEIYNRLLKLTNIENDPDVIPYMNAQTAINELCRYFLGDDWYIVDPLNNEQANVHIVWEIEYKLRKHRAKQ